MHIETNRKVTLLPRDYHMNEEQKANAEILANFLAMFGTANWKSISLTVILAALAFGALCMGLAF